MRTISNSTRHSSKNMAEGPLSFPLQHGDSLRVDLSLLFREWGPSSHLLEFLKKHRAHARWYKEHGNQLFKAIKGEPVLPAMSMCSWGDLGEFPSPPDCPLPQCSQEALTNEEALPHMVLIGKAAKPAFTQRPSNWTSIVPQGCGLEITTTRERGHVYVCEVHTTSRV